MIHERLHQACEILGLVHMDVVYALRRRSF